MLSTVKAFETLDTAKFNSLAVNSQAEISQTDEVCLRPATAQPTHSRRISHRLNPAQASL